MISISSVGRCASPVRAFRLGRGTAARIEAILGPADDGEDDSEENSPDVAKHELRPFLDKIADQNPGAWLCSKDVLTAATALGWTTNSKSPERWMAEAMKQAHKNGHAEVRGPVCRREYRLQRLTGEVQP